MDSVCIILLQTLVLIYLLLYSGFLSNSFLDKLLILSHISLYCFNNFLSLTKRFTYLLLLLKCLVYGVSCGSFMFNGDR